MGDKVIGKVLGSVLGFAMGGPPGAILGFIIGHVHDNRATAGRTYARGDDAWSRMAGYNQDFMGHDVNSASTLGVIVLGAKMAKADGRVSAEEILAFKRVFNVAPYQEASIGAMFDQARQTAHGYEPYALHLADMFRHNPIVLEEILGGLFAIAAADNPVLSASEITYLQGVASFFGFDALDMARIAARAGVRFSSTPYGAYGDDESYAILGVSVTASHDEVKTAYRALIREHHPDKLVAQGVPAEMIATATEKMKRINLAYDTVCKQRGIR